jgi:aspartate dehydrogenase
MLGLLGCGNIGRILANERQKYGGHPQFVAAYDTYDERTAEVAQLLGAVASSSFDEFIAQPFDVLIEAASVAAIRDHGEAALAAGKDLVVLSVGALAEPEFRERLEATAARYERTIHVPSGALFGLDNMKIGRLSEFRSVLLRTTKSPKALGVSVSERTMLFKGGAEACIASFPRNINVAAALALAANHPVEVEIWADPDIETNRHEVVVEGAFGSAAISVSNLPSPDNPATSYLAALSVLTLIDGFDRPLVIGT